MLAMALKHVIGLIWLAFCGLTTTIVICFFAWAIRAGQFRDQKHAANLALEAGDLEDEAPGDTPDEEKE